MVVGNKGKEKIIATFAPAISSFSTIIPSTIIQRLPINIHLQILQERLADSFVPYQVITGFQICNKKIPVSADSMSNPLKPYD
jgi:hypothetical protein